MLLVTIESMYVCAFTADELSTKGKNITNARTAKINFFIFHLDEDFTADGGRKLPNFRLPPALLVYYACPFFD
jgi:hypothetical protein